MISPTKHTALNWILITLLIAASLVLRLRNLGYSEFQDDEKKAIIRLAEGETVKDFLLSQRKGPMQFLVTQAVLTITRDPRNELMLRLPFALISLGSIAVFYLILTKLFKSRLVAFIGTFLFMVNGLMVGFSRIAQYQNINILFSLLTIYLFIKLTETRKVYQVSLLGTTAWCISLLAHWDAIFVLIPFAYFYIKFLLRKDISRTPKIKITLANFVLGCLLLLPFLIPYIKTQVNSTANMEYFDRRVGVSEYTWDKHKFIFELYNPHVTLVFLAVLAFFGLLNIKRHPMLIVWFTSNFLLIRYFMEKPGTHIYNYVIPAIILAASGIQFLMKFKNTFYVALLLPIFVLCVFLYFQAYILFVDHSKEYPWDTNEILTTKNIVLQTERYKGKEVLTFGFPHYRNWKRINEIVASDPDKCTYITNEGKEISQIYMDNKYGIMENRPCYYIVDVARPFITRGTGAVFAKVQNKEPVYTYSKDGKTLVKLYKINTN